MALDLLLALELRHHGRINHLPTLPNLGGGKKARTSVPE
jgi:hypothetical protein